MDIKKATQFRITQYGMPQAIFYPVAAMVIAAVWLAVGLAYSFPFWLTITGKVIFFAVFIWMLSFFRDPVRISPMGENLLISPADGTVADIEEIDEPEFINGKALRIGIFLSVFNVHINRAPCKCRVEKIVYKKGGFKDARHPQATTVNEANTLYLQRLLEPQDKIIVRQISGAIARHIVCRAEVGQVLDSGEKFGMIKFGSRTELIVPENGKITCKVKVGDKVRAGLSILGEYK